MRYFDRYVVGARDIAPRRLAFMRHRVWHGARYPVLNVTSMVMVTVWLLAGSQMTSANDSPLQTFSIEKRHATSVVEFTEDLQKAISRRDRQQLHDLFAWANVEDDQAALAEVTIEQLIGLSSTRLQHQPLFGAPLEYLAGGKRYRANIPLDGLLYLRASGEDRGVSPDPSSLVLPYGRQSDRYYLAIAYPRKQTHTRQPPARVVRTSSKSTAPDERLLLKVTSARSDHAIEFAGACRFTRDGESQMRSFRAVTAIALPLNGERFDVCAVRKIADSNGWIQLQINENGRLLYQSERQQSLDPLVYRRAADG